MLRRYVSAAVVLFVLSGIVFGETYVGPIIKLEDAKVTILVRGKLRENLKGKKAKEKTFKLSKDAKFIEANTEDTNEKEVKAKDVKELLAKVQGTRKTVTGLASMFEVTGEGDDETVTKITFIRPNAFKSK